MGMEECMLTHFLGQQVDILLIATLRSIVKLYQGKSLEKQRDGCWCAIHGHLPVSSALMGPLQPTAFTLCTPYLSSSSD